jgi:hypothetical protein
MPPRPFFGGIALGMVMLTVRCLSAEPCVQVTAVKAPDDNPSRGVANPGESGQIAHRYAATVSSTSRPPLEGFLENP